MRALALQMDEGLGSHVEEFAKELHIETASSNAEGDGDGECEDGDDDVDEDNTQNYDEAQDEPMSP